MIENIIQYLFQVGYINKEVILSKAIQIYKKQKIANILIGSTIGAVSITGLGYTGYVYLPIIITILENVIYASCLGVGLIGSLVMLGTKNRLRTLLGHLYGSTVRGITKTIIRNDPFYILRNYIDELNKRHSKLLINMGRIASEASKIEATITVNWRKIIECKRLIKKYQGSLKNKSSNIVIEDSKKELLIGSNGRLSIRFEYLTDIHSKLNQNSADMTILIGKLNNEVEINEVEWNSIRTSHGVVRDSLKIIKGTYDINDRLLFNETMDSMLIDYETKISEIKHSLKEIEYVSA